MRALIFHSEISSGTCSKRREGIAFQAASGSRATFFAFAALRVVFLSAMNRFFVAILFASSASLSAAELFVSPTGNDAASGTWAAPFATLTRARDEARKFRSEPRTIILRGGTHELPQGLVLSAEDSGTTWRAADGEKPVLVGGRSVALWKPWRDGIVQATLDAKDMKQLFFAGKRQTLARYPNFDAKNPYGGGWAYADGVMWPMYVENPDENKHTLLVKKEDWRTWEHPEDVEVFSFPRYNWWNDIIRIKSVQPADRTVTLSRDGSYAIRANDRYYFQGALEELDAPGEWQFDRRTHTLYFKPPGELSSPVLYPTTRDILKIDGADSVTVRGLTFECADGSAVAISKSQHCRVEACTIRNVGDGSGNGVSVSGGSDNGVVGCDIYEIGRNGVSLGGGETKTLTAAGNFADNCYIHHVGVFYKQGVGVSLDGTGQRVSHCLIHDTPRFGIMFSGNAHILEFNHMRHLALETEDVGATYCGGRDWISPRGTVIRHNYIHDVLGYGWNGKWTSPYFAWGIYLDDNSGGVDVIGNIVVRCGRSLFHGHNAQDARVENNIFVDGGMRQWEFNGWTTQHRFWTSHLDSMIKGYESVAKEPAWKAMRGMNVHPSEVPDSEGRVMKGNIFRRNIIAWKDPEARALNTVAFNPERNDFNRNLYWHHGGELKTGHRIAGKVIGGNLAPNPGFEDGEPGKLPKDWSWQIRTRPDAVAAFVEEGGGRFLRIDASLNKEKKRDNYPIVASRDIVLKPGATYRLRAKMRGDEPGTKASMLVQFYLPPKDGQPGHFWGSPAANAKLTTEWQTAEVVFTVPVRGERGWHDAMKDFRIRFDWLAEKGTLFADDVTLEETESLDEWQSWQQLADKQSIIADPKFIAPEKDDYRLASDSPAFALGFKQIPVEKIGPYASKERATWPIIEAEGAREHPLSP
jgi:hypothetical protein